VRALRYFAAAAGTVILVAAVSLPTESAQLISALTPPAGRGAPAPDPKSFAGMYKAAAASCPGLPWSVVAAIGEVESSHGRLVARSSAGAVGPMQFLPGTWKAYATDGDHNGRIDVHDPADAISTAARLLCANGGGDRETLATAVWNYNHSWEYVAKVINVANQLETAKGA
jgi:hypothetical protein